MDIFIRAQSVAVRAARNNIFNAFCGDNITDMVMDEDRSKLISYIDDEIEKAKSISTGARDYIRELMNLKELLEADND